MRKIHELGMWLFLLTLICALFSCAKEARTPSGIMDTAKHHYLNGMNFIADNDVNKAAHEFQLALELQEDYGPALTGKGLILAIQGNESKSLKLIHKGQSKTENNQEKIWTLVNEIRAYTELNRAGTIDKEELLKKSRKTFSKGKQVDDGASSLYYYQGLAFVQALDFQGAVNMFAKVKTLQNEFLAEANRMWDLVQRADRIAPETTFGKKVVLIEAINRADMAGLLIEEMQLKDFYKRTQLVTQQEYEPPQGKSFSGKQGHAEPSITDIDGHPLQHDITQAVSLGINGLQPYPDHTFRPEENMTRGELAIIFEDIIIRATGNEELATKFIGQNSPFPDIRNDHPYFNAAMLCSSRGLMQSDIRSGLFRPLETLSGVETLEAVMRLKRQLRLFQ